MARFNTTPPPSAAKKPICPPAPKKKPPSYYVHYYPQPMPAYDESEEEVMVPDEVIVIDDDLPENIVTAEDMVIASGSTIITVSQIPDELIDDVLKLAEDSDGMQIFQRMLKADYFLWQHAKLKQSYTRVTEYYHSLKRQVEDKLHIAVHKYNTTDEVSNLVKEIEKYDDIFYLVNKN